MNTCISSSSSIYHLPWISFPSSMDTANFISVDNAVLRYQSGARLIIISLRRAPYERSVGKQPFLRIRWRIIRGIEWRPVSQNRGSFIPQHLAIDGVDPGNFSLNLSWWRVVCGPSLAPTLSILLTRRGFNRTCTFRVGVCTAGI